MTILRVALDVPLPTLFDYRSGDATRADIGYRVLVPFGKKRAVGVIWDVATKSKVSDSRLRSVEKIREMWRPFRASGLPSWNSAAATTRARSAR
jgi:primosomal protein N' (replication factor Y)